MEMKKATKKKEQYEIANVLFEMGMDFEVIKTVSGVAPEELLLKRLNMLDFIEDNRDNKEAEKEKNSYQESRKKGTNKRDSNPTS